MTREYVIAMAIRGEISWLQAADICQLTPRHMRRLRQRYKTLGTLPRDGRVGRRMPHRLSQETRRTMVDLRRSRYADFSVKHVHEKLREAHGIEVSYTWTRAVLVHAGLLHPAPGPGRHFQKRARREMCGMMVHCDASTHVWLAGLPHADLVIFLDDADGRLLFAEFVDQEGTLSTLRGLHHVLQAYGRFAEFYTDRGSHFCTTSSAGHGPNETQHTQVTRVLQTLGIRHILAHTPQARGRCERAFRTLQGRLPQELRDQGIRTYEQANAFLRRQFIEDFNRRFTVQPTCATCAFVPLLGVDLALLCSAHHDRTVRPDNTVTFRRTVLQIPPSEYRYSFAKCKVVVHQFPNLTLGISFQGHVLATFHPNGTLIPSSSTPTTTRQSGHL